jgi:hypothetical protein
MTVSDTVFEKLKTLDTCTVSNAIERLNVRLRNEGFVAGTLRCRFQSFVPMLDYALLGEFGAPALP